MNRPDNEKTVVLALGNRIRSDDAIGLFALEYLQRDTRIDLSVTMVEGGTKGLELVPYVSGASRLLVLDAVEGGAPPGSVLRMQREDLRSLPGSGSVHELALADILNALRVLNQEPQETVLLGVQPETTDLGVSLSPSVEASIPSLVDAAIEVLTHWGCLKSNCDAPNIGGAVIILADSTARD
jgi:hydrogenase maturation protease